MGVYTGFSHGIKVEMQQLKQLLTDDDSAVSPVIGVILMVAITVILAAVIASFVLGLGDQGEPAPQPTIESSTSTDELQIDVTGGDDVDAGVTTLKFETGSDSIEVDLDAQDASGNQIIQELSAGDTITIDTNNDVVEINGDQVASGDITGDPTNLANPADNDWEVEIIWDPSDQDSSVIYSDSS